MNKIIRLIVYTFFLLVITGCVNLTEEPVSDTPLEIKTEEVQKVETNSVQMTEPMIVSAVVETDKLTEAVSNNDLLNDSEAKSEDEISTSVAVETSEPNLLEPNTEAIEETMTWTTSMIQQLGLSTNKTIEVYGGDLSGDREPNVKVDVGFGDREYWAFTNEHSQLIVVIAENIILQDDSTEPVTSSGRYYSDEAKVPGVESATLDEGHVIADSLGGTSCSMNITPQNSTLNRHGDQAYMEAVIRQADGCEKFIAIITYENITTQIPSHYDISYTINGNDIIESFDNINPEEVKNEDTAVVTGNIEENTVPDEVAAVVIQNQVEKIETVEPESHVEIVHLDKKAEYVVIKNNGTLAVDISGWKLISEKGADSGGQTYIFSSGYILDVGETVTLIAGKDPVAMEGEIIMANKNIWNNSDPDAAVLFNRSGVEVSRKN